MKKIKNRPLSSANRASSLRFARGKGSTPSRPKKRKKEQESGPSIFAQVAQMGLRFCGRGLKMVLTVAASVAALGLISVALIAVYLYVSKSDYFLVKRVVISGINQTSHDEIETVAGLKQAVNILTYDLEEAEAKLSTLPWVDEVRVTRQMPDAVTITVREHVAKLLVTLGRLYYLNEKGEPFKELGPGENPNLPIVSGFNEDQLLSPGPATKAAITEVFYLADTLAARNDEFRLDNISEINYDMVRGLTIFTKSNGLEVKIGFGAYEEKFRRLGRVLAHLKLRNKYDGLVYLNLEASPRVTVRYAGPEARAAASLTWVYLEPTARPQGRFEDARRIAGHC